MVGETPTMDCVKTLTMEQLEIADPDLRGPVSHRPQSKSFLIKKQQLLKAAVFLTDSCLPG